MRLDLARLPTDPVLLQRVVRELAEVLERQDAELTATKARLAERDAELEKLQLFLTALKRLKFGRSSEKQHPDQLTLALEAIEEQIAALPAKSEPAVRRPPRPRRSPPAGRCPAVSRGRAPPARACGLRLSGLRRQAARHWRGRLGSSRLRAGAVQGDPPRPAALACRACESIPPHRRCRRCRSSAAGRDQGCWPRCWSPSSAIICRFCDRAMVVKALGVQRAGPSFCPWSTGVAT